MTTEGDKKDRPLCPVCNRPMMMAGKGWSGKNRVQRYRCGGCGKVIQRADQAY